MTARNAGFDLNLLAPLDALLATRSVTKAARTIGVSQSTMSGMLARLRDQLHDPLLVRVGRSLEPTPRAIELAQEVRQMLIAIDRLARPRTDFAAQTLDRHFRIMASEFGLFLILPQVFREATKHAPGVTFEILPIDRPAESIYTGAVDLCVTGDMIGSLRGDMADGVRTQVLMEDDLIGVVDRAHPLEGAITLDEFLAFPHVVTQFPGSPWTVEDIGLGGLSDRHPPRIRVPSFIAIGHMVAGSSAIGVMPSRMRPMLGAGLDLRTIGLPREFARLSIRALWHERDDRDPAHHWLRQLVASVCARETVAGR